MVQTMVVAVAIGILLAIAYQDARTRRIPNALTTAIAILGTMRLILANDLAAALHTLIVTALVFAVAFCALLAGYIWRRRREVYKRYGIVGRVTRPARFFVHHECVRRRAWTCDPGVGRVPPAPLPLTTVGADATLATLGGARRGTGATDRPLWRGDRGRRCRHAGPEACPVMPQWRGDQPCRPRPF